MRDAREHDKNLENALHQIRAEEMILNMEEYHFRSRCFKFIGLCTEHGTIKANSEKTETFRSNGIAQLLIFSDFIKFPKKKRIKPKNITLFIKQVTLLCILFLFYVMKMQTDLKTIVNMFTTYYLQYSNYRICSLCPEGSDLKIFPPSITEGLKSTKLFFE